MKKIHLILATFACLALIGGGCSKVVDAPATPNDDAKEEVTVQNIKVGLMVPLSGDVAAYGNSVRRGVELAKEKLGLDHVELVFEDTKCDGKEAASGITKIISIDGVHAIIGELCSGASLAAAPIANAQKVPMISPGSTSPKLTQDGGDYFFRTVPSDALQGSFGAKLVAEKGLKKLAVLYTNEDYGVGFDGVLKEEFPKTGGEVVASEAVELKSVDMRSQLTKIKASEADAIYIISNSPDTAAAALKQIKELDIKAQVFASEGLKSQDVVDGAQGGAEGMILSTVSAGNQGFLEAHKEKFGEEPGPFAAQAYDALQALGWVATEGAGTGEAIMNKLKEAEFDGASGKIKFDDNGDIEGNYDVFMVKDGEFVQE